MDFLNYIFKSNIINFIIVALFFIWLLFYKLDIVNLFENKKNEIVDAIKKSENKKDNAIKHFGETKEALKNVDVEVGKIVLDAKDIADSIKTKSKDKLNEELANLEVRAKALKEAHVGKARDEVSKKVANAAIAVSKEYIENSLDENAHKELVYNFINDLENMRVE